MYVQTHDICTYVHTYVMCLVYPQRISHTLHTAHMYMYVRTYVCVYVCVCAVCVCVHCSKHMSYVIHTAWTVIGRIILCNVHTGMGGYVRASVILHYRPTDPRRWGRVRLLCGLRHQANDLLGEDHPGLQVWFPSALLRHSSPDHWHSEVRVPVWETGGG